MKQSELRVPAEVKRLDTPVLPGNTAGNATATAPFRFRAGFGPIRPGRSAGNPDAGDRIAE